jgi:hypothetical protein
MKISYYILISILLILWESFLGFSGIFSWIELLPAFTIALFIHQKGINTLLLWTAIMAFILDFIIGRWIGIGLFAIFLPLLLLDLINRFFTLYENDRNIITVIIFTILSQLTMSFISIISGSDFVLIGLFRNIIINLLISLMLYRLLKGLNKREFIKV